MKPLPFIVQRPLVLSLVALLFASCASTPEETPLPEPPLESAPSVAAPSAPTVSSEDPISRISGNWAFNRSEAADLSEIPPGAPDPIEILNKNLANSKITIHEDGSSVFTSGAVTNKFTFTLLNETSEEIHFNVIGTSNPTQLFIYEKGRDRLVQPINVQINQTKGSIRSYYTRVR